MARMTPPSFDFYPDRYLGNTIKFTVEQHGAFLLLLMEQWQEGEIPTSEAEQMMICRVHDKHQWDRIWARVKVKFELIEDGEKGKKVLVNRRMWEDRTVSVEKYTSAVERARENGKKSKGRPKHETKVGSQLETDVGFSENPLPEGGRGKREEGSKEKEKEWNFDRFWNLVPSHKKRSKGDAEKAFTKALNQVDDPRVIFESYEAYASSDEGQTQYANMPSAWLNKKRWTDDPASWSRSENGNTKQIEF